MDTQNVFNWQYLCAKKIKILVGQHTTKDIKQLNLKYTWKPLHDTHIAHLYFTNEDKDKHNKKVFQQILGQTYILEAKDYKNLTCNKSSQIPKMHKKTARLHQKIKLKIYMIVEICSSNY